MRDMPRNKPKRPPKFDTKSYKLYNSDRLIGTNCDSRNWISMRTKWYLEKKNIEI